MYMRQETLVDDNGFSIYDKLKNTNYRQKAVTVDKFEFFITCIIEARLAVILNYPRAMLCSV